MHNSLMTPYYKISIPQSQSVNFPCIRSVSKCSYYCFKTLIASLLPKFLFIAACTGFKCPTGSTCKVCEETGTAYCEFSCSIDNGGCPAGSTCTESAVTCPPGQCCSPQIDCEGMVKRIL